MARIKIRDLPKSRKIDEKEMRMITGGVEIESDKGTSGMSFPDVCLTPYPGVEEPVPVAYPSTKTPEGITTKDSTKDTPEDFLIIYDNYQLL